MLIERLSVVFLRPLRVLSRTLRGASYKPDHHSVGEPLGGFFPHLSLAVFLAGSCTRLSFASCLAGYPKHCCSSAANGRRKGEQINNQPCIRHIQRPGNSELSRTRFLLVPCIGFVLCPTPWGRPPLFHSGTVRSSATTCIRHGSRFFFFFSQKSHGPNVVCLSLNPRTLSSYHEDNNPCISFHNRRNPRRSIIAFIPSFFSFPSLHPSFVSFPSPHTALPSFAHSPIVQPHERSPKAVP